MDYLKLDAIEFQKWVGPRHLPEKGLLIDPYVSEAFTKLLGDITYKQFEGWTRSFYTERNHYNSFYHYNQKLIPEPESKEWKAACSATLAEFINAGDCTAISFKEGLSQVPFVHSSAAGYSYGTAKKGDPGVLEKAIKTAHATLRSFQRNGGFAVLSTFSPDQAFVRTQLSEMGDSKVRHIWGRSFHNILLEGICAYPLLEMLTHNDKVPIYTGYTLAELNHLIRSFGEKDSTSYGIDWSRFDATVQPWEIERAMDILMHLINFPSENELACFEFARFFLIHKPVVMPRGDLYYVHSGVPSGSYFTMLVDSIINLNRLNYLMIKCTGQTFPKKVLGDDSLFSIPQHFGVTLEKLASAALEHGWIINTAKSIATSNPDLIEFLGHQSKFATISRDEARVLRLALYPEYKTESPQLTVDKLISLWIDSGLQYHTLKAASDYICAKYKVRPSGKTSAYSSMQGLIIPLTGVTDIINLWKLLI